MALAIKRVHNLPPHVSYVSTLFDIYRTQVRDTDELKQMTAFLTTSSTKPLISGKHGCVHLVKVKPKGVSL